MTGPAYFVSHGGAAFPDLDVVLQGDGVTVILTGDTFISKAGITSSTFAAVPDVPITRFDLTLPRGTQSALTANGNLCKGKLLMPTTIKARTAPCSNSLRRSRSRAVRRVRRRRNPRRNNGRDSLGASPLPAPGTAPIRDRGLRDGFQTTSAKRGSRGFRGSVRAATVWVMSRSLRSSELGFSRRSSNWSLSVESRARRSRVSSRVRVSHVARSMSCSKTVRTVSSPRSRWR